MTETVTVKIRVVKCSKCGEATSLFATMVAPIVDDKSGSVRSVNLLMC
jgi:hypothetical protein